MNIKLLNNIDEIINKFEIWYKDSDHSKNEDKYVKIINATHLKTLNDDDLVTLFKKCIAEGFGIQSGGARNAGKVEEYFRKNIIEFRAQILKPFEKDFDLKSWLIWTESIPGFGQGSATCYLNRVDKNTFCIVNTKSMEAFSGLVYNIRDKNLVDIYNDIYSAQIDLRKRYPDLNNFYKVDSLSQFLIGVDEGKQLLNQPFFTQLQVDTFRRYAGVQWDKKSEERKRPSMPPVLPKIKMPSLRFF